MRREQQKRGLQLQSQRRDPSTSPVRRSEWSLTIGSHLPVPTLGVRIRTSCRLPGTRYARIVKRPKRVCRLAVARPLTPRLPLSRLSRPRPSLVGRDHTWRATPTAARRAAHPAESDHPVRRFRRPPVGGVFHASESVAWAWTVASMSSQEDSTVRANRRTLATWGWQQLVRGMS